VLLSSPFIGVLLAVVFAMNPFAVLLTLVPGFIVVGAFIWLDRVEPEPASERVHAFLWGATFAALVGSLLNDVAAGLLGYEWALVLSAPVGEEVLKALGVLVAVRRRRLRSWFDGVVYAGFVAAGFALVENAVYFFDAAETGQLPVVFVGRGLATPFAHPLFTMFTGMFIGRFSVLRSPRALLGLPIAIALHAAWNAASLLDEVYAVAMLLTAVVLFCSVLAMLVRIRIRSTRVYQDMVPVLAFRFGFDPLELSAINDWEAVRRTRAALPRDRLVHFEKLHTAVLLAGRSISAGETIPTAVVESLQTARQTFSERRLPPPRP
jgi:protease PrsW